MYDAATRDQLTTAWTPSRGMALARTGLLVALVLSITFPYVQIVPIGSYTQPYPLVISIAILVLTRFSGLREMRWTDAAALASLALVGLLLFALTCFPYRNVQEYKYLLTYISPLIIAGACVTALDWNRALVARLIAGSIVIWFWIAMVQALLNPAFITFFLGEWGNAAADIAASGRGVMGLAPEPTHHAFHMLLLAGGIALLGRHRWAILLCLISVVLLARSANGILVLGLALAVALFVYRPRLAMLLFLVVFGIIALPIGDMVLAVAEGNRVLTLVGIVLSNPVDLMLEDFSTNIRVGGALAGFLEAGVQLLYPQGLSSQYWAAHRETMMVNYPFLMNISTVGVPSGYGVILFQAGILVVPFIIASTRRMVLAVTHPLDRVAIFCVPLVFVFQYYISAPQFALAYGIAIYMHQFRQRA